MAPSPGATAYPRKGGLVNPDSEDAPKQSGEANDDKPKTRHITDPFALLRAERLMAVLALRVLLRGRRKEKS